MKKAFASTLVLGMAFTMAGSAKAEEGCDEPGVCSMEEYYEAIGLGGDNTANDTANDGGTLVDALKEPKYEASEGPACFQNRQMEGSPVLCLELRHREGRAAGLWQAQLCKLPFSGGALHNDIAWMVSDEFGDVQSEVFSTRHGVMCSEWEDINLSGLPCGSPVTLQAEIDSPASGDAPAGRYYTGALLVIKAC